MEEGGEEETKKVTFDAEEADNVDDIDLESFGKKKKKKKKRDGLDMDDVKVIPVLKIRTEFTWILIEPAGEKKLYLDLTQSIKNY